MPTKPKPSLGALLRKQSPAKPEPIEQQESFIVPLSPDAPVQAKVADPTFEELFPAPEVPPIAPTVAAAPCPTLRGKGQIAPSEGYDFTKDPRPDLGDDHHLWSALLEKAYREDGDQEDGLFGALHGLRCLGARLERDGQTVKIVPGEIDPVEYFGQFDADGEKMVGYRERYLMPHRVKLTRLLRAL